MQPGDLVGGRFRIQSLAGRGGMGAVYRATDEIDGTTSAVKITGPRDVQDAKRFVREAAVLAKLAHPAIVQYRAHGVTEQGDLFLAMEWVDGKDLAATLAGGALTLRDACTVGVRIAEALAVVHGAGIVHRDLKPSNIVLADGDVAQAKLVDFGIAHV